MSTHSAKKVHWDLKRIFQRLKIPWFWKSGLFNLKPDKIKSTNPPFCDIMVVLFYSWQVKKGLPFSQHQTNVWHFLFCQSFQGQILFFSEDWKENCSLERISRNEEKKIIRRKCNSMWILRNQFSFFFLKVRSRIRSFGISFWITLVRKIDLNQY